MPQLGESVTEGTLGRWLKQVGDPVQKYEPIAEVITDKVTAEVPSDVDGRMAEHYIAEGTTVAVGTVICRIETLNEEETGSQPTSSSVPADSSSKASLTSTLNEDRHQVEKKANSRSLGRYSPAVLRLAEEHQVDLRQVMGSGEGGRITRKDVLAFIEQGSQPSMAIPETKQTELSSAVPSSAKAPEHSQPAAAQARATENGDYTVLPATPIRRTIARRMLESKRTAPHAWTMVEVDATSLVRYRDRQKKGFVEREGVSLTYLPFFIKAVANALRQYPMLNAAWVDDEIRLMKNIHISIAIATDDALVVPVIHHADRLSVTGIAHALNDLATRARNGKLTMADMEGGTFTVNNTGAFGSILSQPIINQPQAAILSVESIVKRPMVMDDDMIAIRHMVNLCLSLDHRLLDGWVAGQFLKAVKEQVEQAGEHLTLG